jgi:hypothetical protein
LFSFYVTIFPDRGIQKRAVTYFISTHRYSSVGRIFVVYLRK